MPSQNYKKRTLTFRHRGDDFLTVSAVIQLHDSILAVSGGLQGIRELGLLGSAIQKPVEGFAGQETYPTFFSKVAAVGFSIAQNHVFSDANKRTALQTMLATLALNKINANPHEQAATTVMILVATGNLDIAGLRVALIHWCGLNPGDDAL
jgi:death on curing protein